MFFGCNRVHVVHRHLNQSRCKRAATSARRRHASHFFRILPGHAQERGSRGEHSCLVNIAGIACGTRVLVRRDAASVSTQLPGQTGTIPNSSTRRRIVGALGRSVTDSPSVGTRISVAMFPSRRAYDENASSMNDFISAKCLLMRPVAVAALDGRPA